ncbi:MAG: DJ-1 family protein [Eggerthellaceae bacterium]|nr:DJ-1 family protein [Eggerthellaceae bacterium]
MKKTAAIMIGEGFEPVEAVAPADVLRRGGVEVALISVMGQLNVEGAQGVELVTGALERDVDLNDFDMLIVPGGSVGVDNLSRCGALADALRERMAEGRLTASICAGPTILADLGLLEGRKAVCYPGCQDGFPAGTYQSDVDVCVDGNLITATGPGSALWFGVACLRALMGDDVADQVAADMLVK